MSDQFKIPNIHQLDQQAQADITAELPHLSKRPRRSYISVLGKVCAGLASGLYGYGAWILRMAMPDTTEGRYLRAWCSIWGIYQKKADYAYGDIIIHGAAGSEIPKGTMVEFAGQTYQTVSGGIIGDEEVITINVKAVNAGVQGNLETSTDGFLINPIAGVKTTTSMASSFSGGTDDEADEDLRYRLLLRLRKPPMGGNLDDWQRWSLEVSGVSRVWISRHEMGRGSLTIRFMMDNTYDDGFPREQDIQRMYDHLTAYDRKPVTADVYVVAPVPFPVDIEINNLNPDTPEVRENIRQNLAAFFKANGKPGAWIYRSKLIEAISLATGEDWHDLALPASNLRGEHAGHLPVLGEVRFNHGE